jgi:hypothetical protein
VREDGRIVGGEGWQEKVHDRGNGRSSWEQQGIVEFCTRQWNEWMNVCGSVVWLSLIVVTLWSHVIVSFILLTLCCERKHLS